MGIFSRADKRAQNAATKFEWPDCEPPNGPESTIGMTDGYHQYHQVEVSPGRWQWKINEEAEKQMREMEAHQFGLFALLTTRAMTADELRSAAAYGLYLNVPTGVSYSAEQKARELQIAWTLQQILQTAEARSS